MQDVGNLSLRNEAFAGNNDSSFLGSPSELYDKTNPDWAPTQNMGHGKIKNTKAASERDARSKERGIKRKRAEVAAQAQYIEESQVPQAIWEIRPCDL